MAALLVAALAPAATFAQSVRRDNNVRQAPAPAATTPSTHWVQTATVPMSSPSNNPSATPKTFVNQTLRMIIRTSVGGTAVRVKLSNVFGTAALNVGAVHVALRSAGANTVAGSDHPLTFSGQGSISIPAGAIVESDPAAMSVPQPSDLAVSVYFPDANTVVIDQLPSTHKTNYISTTGGGDASGATTFPLDLATPTTTLTAGYVVSGVSVLAAVSTPSFVCFGDSITEGTGSTDDANARWPDFFTQRLFAQGRMAGVVDQGIAGDRLLQDKFGPSGLSRFDRDVLSQEGVTHMLMLLGINDIGLLGTGTEPSAADLIAGYRQLIARAHDRGVKIMASPMTPFKGASVVAGSPSFYTDTKEAIRTATNNWIRTSAEFDGLVDFDQALASPNDPLALNPAYDSGDHLHPNDAGKQVMANAIDLTLFNGFVTLNSVVSRKTHGAGAGVFDLPLPQGLCTSPAIESRSGGANGAYTLVFSFATPVTSILGAAVAEGAGSVASMGIDPNDTRNVTVTLSGVSEKQYVTVGLTNVSDALGNTSSVRATLGVLVGDTGGSGSVNAADVAQTRSLSGQGVNAGNFRADLNLDGVINAADLAFVKSRSGTALPAAATNVNP